jgi:hypothetical protein
MQSTQWHVFKQLLITDFTIFKQVVWDKLFNFMIWVSATLLVTTYLLPQFGLSTVFASFLLASAAASGGLFEVFPSTVNLVSDFEGDNVTAYYLTLPINATLLWIRSLLYYAISSATLSIFVLPVGKLLLQDRFSFEHVQIIPFACMFILANLFYGSLTLWLASKVQNMTKIGNVWMRFIFPLWFLGGYQFTWYSLHKVFPMLAYLNLLNPMIYITEGFRGALLEPNNYLRLPVCIGMTALFCLLTAYVGINKLRERLDFI